MKIPSTIITALVTIYGLFAGANYPYLVADQAI